MSETKSSLSGFAIDRHWVKVRASHALQLDIRYSDYPKPTPSVGTFFFLGLERAPLAIPSGGVKFVLHLPDGSSITVGTLYSRFGDGHSEKREDVSYAFQVPQALTGDLSRISVSARPVHGLGPMQKIDKKHFRIYQDSLFDPAFL